MIAKIKDLYSEMQRKALRELEDHYMREEDDEISYSPFTFSFSSYQSSTQSLAASAVESPNLDGIYSYFDKIEERLETQEEFFKEDEFNV